MLMEAMKPSEYETVGTKVNAHEQEEIKHINYGSCAEIL